MKPLKEIEIAVGICEREEKILLIQRRDTNPMWDKKWEFPGGKLEAGEGDVRLEEEKAYAHAWPTPTEALDYDSLSANNDILYLFLHARTQNVG